MFGTIKQYFTFKLRVFFQQLMYTKKSDHAFESIYQHVDNINREINIGVGVGFHFSVTHEFQVSPTFSVFTRYELHNIKTSDKETCIWS